MDNYIRDIQADIWLLKEDIDFLKYETKPINKVMELQKTILLHDRDITNNLLIALRRHEIETEDNYM